jgi:hypothetical protein
MSNRHALAVNLLQGLWFYKIGLVLDEIEQCQGSKHIRSNKGWHQNTLFGLFQIRSFNALQHGARSKPPEVI